jgi:hypothetical protein
MGIRAAQRRREDLFGAELRLRRIQLHLLNAMGNASYYGADADVLGYNAALGVVGAALVDVLREVKDLT